MARLMTPVELAEMLGIPLATIYTWKSEGKGPTPIRVGRHLRFRAADVETWIDQQAAKTAAKAS